MSITPDSKRPWWREPMVWLIAGLPLAAVVAGITTVVIASRNADSLVKEGYVKEGMTVQGTQEQDRAATRLGLAAHLGSEAGTLTLGMQSGNRAIQWPSLLLMTLAHPTDAAQDASLVLKHTGQGLYSGALPDLPPGRRQLIVESHEQGWRLKGAWEVPFRGTLTLVADPTGK